MGRHSRGSGEGIPPSELPEAPDRHPYAPRSAGDTGDRDRGTYRVVDVGLPPGAPGAAFPLDGSAARRSVPGAPNRYGAGDSGRSGGSTRADRHDEPRYGSRPDARPAEEPRFGATRADLEGAQFRARPEADERRFGTAQPDPGATSFRTPPSNTPETPRPDRRDDRFTPPSESGDRFGAPRPDTGGDRFGGPRADSGAGRFGASRAGAGQRFGATRADLIETGGSETRLPPPAVDPAGSRFGGDRSERFGSDRFGADPEPREPTRAEPRYGATRAESLGSTALAPRPEQPPDRDEVTDTGARRARSAFRLAPEADETDETDDVEEHDDRHEPGLLLQWGIFFAETLTGAAAGLGAWLGFYRLWSTWPFYAAPGVGVAAIVLLVLARTLRRRHGRELDLLTAIVTFGIITVLTVLPAAFTLRGVQ